MKRKTKLMMGLVSLVLCLSMGLLLPVQVYAESISGEDVTYPSFDNIKGEDEEIGDIVAELEEERTEYSKVFLLDDGTKMVAQYDQPVHYENERGKWIDFDNTLVSEGSNSTADEVSTDGDFVNKSSDIEIKLSKKAKQNNMVKITSADYSISWGYDNAQKVVGKIVNNDVELSGNDEFTTLTNLSSETVYENVFKNVDLQYIVSSTGVKENIILRSSDVQNEFNITYKINKLTAKQIDDYCITLYDKSGNEVTRIVAPYMTDAKGNISTRLQIKIESQKGANLKVKLTAENSFIHSLGRAFPIVIDPEITTGLYNKMYLTACTNNTALSYPPYKLSNDSFTVLTMRELPELADGERIISAKLNLTTENGSSVLSSENADPIIIKAHRLGTVSGNTVTYQDEVIDYDSLSYEDNEDFTLDITKLLKEWYDNGNNLDAVVFEAFDTIGTRAIYVKGSYRTSQIKPSLTYVFKDFTGTESNLSYHTINAGHNATASVSDYLGNLVLTQNVFEGTGSRMPFSVYLTYNSINYDKKFENGSPSGKGWQFSFNQYVRDTTGVLAEQGYNYVYTDADGTDHYLKKDSEGDSWYDEDGLGLILSVDTSNIFIDNGSVIQTYELPATGGKLLSEKDEYNNTITYNYTDGNLTSVVDGAGRTTLIYYTANSNNENRVSKIKSPDNKYLFFYYTSDDQIDYMLFGNAMRTRYEYSDGRIITVKDEYIAPPTSGQSVTFEYDENAKVTKITEIGSDGTEGNYLNIEYNDDNTTLFTDRNGKSATYTFDNSGSLISVLNPNGYLESGDTSGLSFAGGAETFTKNYITKSTEHGTVGSNSGSYYFKVNASKGSLTSSGGVCSVDTSAPSEENGQVQFIGNSSIKINNPVSSSNSAFFTAVAHQFNGTTFNGKDVTFSAYVKTKDIQQIYSGGAVGASLKIKCFDSSDSGIAECNSIGITGTEDWQRLSISCSIPANTAKVRVYCMIRYASGTAWFDCLQLEEGDTASDFNALQNSDFSSSSNWSTNENNTISVQNGTVVLEGTPAVYNDANEEPITPSNNSSSTSASTYTETVTETQPYDTITTYDDYGNVIKTEQGFVTRTVKKTYEAEPEGGLAQTGASYEEEETETTSLGNNYIYQDVNIGRAGVKFNISGEAQANSVPLSNSNRTFGIALNIYYQGESVPEMHYKEFNAYTSHKQSVSCVVTPDSLNKVVDHVAFAFVYGYNENSMTISNAMLNVALATYSSFEDTEEETESSEDNWIDYEVLSESVDKTQTYMETSSTYDSTGNYVTAETDEAGNTITYTYDTCGNVTSVTDGRGNTTNYAYNTENRITSISSGNASNTYSYSNIAGNVTQINHNGFSYKFNYDVFDNLIASKVGSVTLSSNTYSAHNGNLLRTDYANGDYITYTYDDYGNIIELAGETGTIAQFVYNKKGLISKLVDVPNNTTTYYYHDFEGNVTGEYRQSADGSLSYYMSVDSDGNQVEKTSVNGQTKMITSGTDSEGTSFISYDGVTVDTTSDDFGRTTQVKTSKSGNANSFFTEYEYANGSAANSTTNLVSKLTQKYGDNELVNYQYTYNANGDITYVNENGTRVAVYTYDNLNQLSWYADKNTELYKKYTYDDAGNIINVKEYQLSTNGWYPNGLLSENTYSYGDTNWKDKLTSFNGQTITYDANGNPLNYRDSMSFTWVNGRILDTVTVSNNTLTMKYDSNGLRTKKGSIKYYYDKGNNLIGMVSGNNTLLFYYDESGSLTSFSHNGTMYFYIKNLQGDIQKIVNTSGVVVANYTYDAWGKLLGVTDSNGNPITSSTNVALLNPLRYRGYVYDEETGLYYLQNRYYDPIIGRFLNEDIYCDTGNSVLSTNMFTYSENNPINYVDPYGTDAYWLQDVDAMGGVGHTSLLIQQGAGKWWYFYWGISDIQLLYFGKGTLKDLNKFVQGNNKWRYKFYKGNYKYWEKIKGNFVPCLNYIFYTLMGHNKKKSIVSYSMEYVAKKNGKWWGYHNSRYHLTRYNCVQVSIEVLLKGKFTGKKSTVDAFKRAILKSYLKDKTVNGCVPTLIYYNLWDDYFFAI